VTAVCEKQRRQFNSPGGGEAMDSMINTFHKAVAEGPIYVCISCDQLFYGTVSKGHRVYLNGPPSAQE
jgi:hypothetical protein